MLLPRRYVNLEDAREAFGDRVDRLGPFLWRMDPLADDAIRSLSVIPRPDREAVISRGLEGAQDVPEGLRALVASVQELPVWWDPQWAERGAQVLVRSGLAGGVVLAFKCLITSYCSPAGNKPLVFSGRLEEDVPRRLAETGRFIQAMSQPAGLHPGTDAFRAALRVRLVHAQVRAFLVPSERWNREEWGAPINQADMAGTVLLFSHVFLEGLEQCGLAITPEEREAVIHLWRGAGFLLGVEPELLCGSEREARILWRLIRSTQEPADEDSRRLARALLGDTMRQAVTPEQRRTARVASAVQLALTRQLIGASLADALKLPASPLRFGWPVLRRMVHTLDQGIRLTGLGDELTRRVGQSYWRRAVGGGLAAVEVALGVPTRLRRL